MPEYLEPGVFVEEVSLRGKAIEGVSTNTTAFVGMTAKGPIGTVSDLITNYGEFERIYGDDGDLSLAGQNHVNYLARAARSFFDNGGRRLYVVRISPPEETSTKTKPARRFSFRTLFQRMMRFQAVAPSAPKVTYRDALRLLEAVDDVSIVAAPTAAHSSNDPVQAMASLRSTHAELITHVDRMGHRIAVLDVPKGIEPNEASQIAANLNSPNAALYYPWVISASDSVSMPPSGAVCGIYARTDTVGGVWKAPAGVAIRNISGFERDITEIEQNDLNPFGVNVLRKLPGKGLMVYGSRTLSSDPEWRYVPVRRFFQYLQKSINDGLDWVVFEPNDEPLWEACRNRVEGFLLNNWRYGALQGDKAEDAFFVRCDRTTMTQADIDNGRLICEIGFAPLRPAEFVILRVTKTLSSPS